MTESAEFDIRGYRPVADASEGNAGSQTGVAGHRLGCDDVRLFVKPLHMQTSLRVRAKEHLY